MSKPNPFFNEPTMLIKRTTGGEVIWHNRNLKRATITEGKPDCVHYEIIQQEQDNGLHWIGRCKYCGRVRDYTVLQAVYQNNRSLSKLERTV